MKETNQILKAMLTLKIKKNKSIAQNLTEPMWKKLQNSELHKMRQN